MRVPYENCPDLFIDFALDARSSRDALFHFCGVHGIEGYCGSAVQREILRDLPAHGPSLLFVHAVNPYGMALYRRNNGENVDLNRNFLAALPSNPDYRLFDSYLNPRSPAAVYTGAFRALLARARLGAARTAQAVAAGQSDFPQGLFYTGRTLQRELLLVHDFLRAHFSQAENLVAIDLHTGLGERGQELLFADGNRDPGCVKFFTRIFGRPVDTPDPRAGSYVNHGRFSDLIRRALPDAKLSYVLEEFGTCSKTAALKALRQENFDWHRRPRGSEPSEAVRAAMLNAFFPASAEWRARVIELGARRWREAHRALR
jgi:hypothetical protein